MMYVCVLNSTAKFSGHINLKVYVHVQLSYIKQSSKKFIPFIAEIC